MRPEPGTTADAGAECYSGECDTDRAACHSEPLSLATCFRLYPSTCTTFSWPTGQMPHPSILRRRPHLHSHLGDLPMASNAHLWSCPQLWALTVFWGSTHVGSPPLRPAVPNPGTDQPLLAPVSCLHPSRCSGQPT